MVMYVKTHQAAVDEEGRPFLSPNLDEANALHRLQLGKRSLGEMCPILDNVKKKG